MPESINHPTPDESRRWRLIDPRGKNESSFVEGSQLKADAYGLELSDIYGNKVLVTELLKNGVPVNHHFVGKNRVTNQTNTKEPNMGTTKMSPEPRTTNGNGGEVTTELEKSTVLDAETKAQLAAKREAAKTNGKTTTKKATPKAKAAPKPKAEPKIKKSDLGQALTQIRKTLKTLSDEQHETATAIRKELTASWHAIDGGIGIDGYIATVQTARGFAHDAKLTATVKAADAAVALAEESKKQS